jgi:hypothetical protein
MYSPRLRRNLISGSRIDIKGATFTCSKGEVKVTANGQHLFFSLFK